MFRQYLSEIVSDARLKSFVWDLAKEGYAFRTVVSSRRKLTCDVQIRLPTHLARRAAQWCRRHKYVPTPHRVRLRRLTHGDFTAELARRFKEDGMLAYVKLVQQREKELGCDVLTHQKW